MPFAHYKRPALRRPTFNLTQSPVSLGPKAPTLTFASVAPPNNNFFQKFMWTFMEKDLVLAAPITPAIKARNNTNTLFKSRNPDIYYGHLYIE